MQRRGIVVLSETKLPLLVENPSRQESLLVEPVETSSLVERFPSCGTFGGEKK